MRFRLLVAALAAAFTLLILWLPDAGLSTPCEYHRGHAKVACVKAHRVQVRRDRMAYPPHPTMRDVRLRMSASEINTLIRIGRCEQPGSGRWGIWWTQAGPTYVGGLGMFTSTYGIGVSRTGYPYPPTASPEQQLLTASVVLRMYGPTAWGCG